MIKKTITVLSMFILSASLIWAVWEGNAAAGSPEEFPSGLFASSDLFPKYTLIEISNLEQNTTSRAVVIGKSGTDGLLIKVSPDLAKALTIKKGRAVRVRVSIPPLVAEAGADPVLLNKADDKQSGSPDSSEKPKTEDSSIISEEVASQDDSKEDSNKWSVQSEPAPPEVSEPVYPIAGMKEESAESVPVAEVKPIQPRTKSVPEEPVAAIVEVEEPMQPEMSVVPQEPVASIAEVSEPLLLESESVSAAPVSEVSEPSEAPPQSGYFAEAEKPVTAVSSIQEAPVQEESDASNEYVKPVRRVAEIAAPEETAESNETLSPIPEVSSPIEPQPVAIEEAEPEKDTEEPVKDTEAPVEEPALIAVEPNEEQAEEVEELRDEPAVAIAEEALVEKEAEDNAVEQHVMLVPAEPRVPVREYPPVPKEPEKPAVPVKPVVTQPAEELYTANVLKKGSFYVQVGRFKDMLNVESFVQMYGKQYPVAIEKSSTPQAVFYKVYVGPLQKDERGAALETFQKLGFKDAFLKKAP